MKTEIKNNDSVADYAMTRARMEKMIFRAIEEDRLKEEDLELQKFSLVMKEVGQNFVDDIMEEEIDNMIKIIKKKKIESKNNYSKKDNTMTKDRMEKMILISIEEDRIKEEDLELQNISLVMKEIGQNFVDDIMEEEKDNMIKIIEKQIKKKMPH